MIACERERREKESVVWGREKKRKWRREESEKEKRHKMEAERKKWGKADTGTRTHKYTLKYAHTHTARVREIEEERVCAAHLVVLHFIDDGFVFNCLRTRRELQRRNRLL